MADMEVGFNIGVGAEADVGSAKKAVNDLTKGILSSLKDGYIEVPAEVKTSFNKGSKELEKAQKDVIAQWEKMSKKGFSSSEDYLDDLITKYKKFKSLAGKEGKGNSKQSRWLTSNIGELLQPYLDQKGELEKILASSKAKVSSSNKKQYSQSAINKALEQSYNEANKKRNLRTGLKSVVPRGFKRNVGWDTGVATTNTVRQSDLSPYGSNYARQMRISELAAVKWMKDSLKVYKDNDLANQFVEEAIKKGNNKNQFTAKSEFSTKAKLASDELAKILSGLEKGKPEATLKEFDKYLESIFNFSNKSGAGSLSGTLLALNRTFGRYFSTSGALGITDGSEKGVGPGHEQAQQALLAMIQKFKKKLDSDLTVKIKENSQVKISPEQLRQLKALAGVDSRAWEKEIDKILYADRTDTANKKSKNTENNLLSREINNNTKATEKQTQYDIIDNSREGAADKKQEDMATSLNEIERTDAEDGGNSATNFALLLSKLDGFTSIFESIQGIIQTVLGDTTSLSKNIDQVAENTQPEEKRSTEQLQEIYESLRNAVKPMTQLALSSGKPIPVEGTFKNYYEGKDIVQQQKKQKPSSVIGQLERSLVETSIKDYSKRFPDNYQKIMAATSKEQDAMNAERIRRYGIGSTDRPTDSGDRIKYARRMSFWRNSDSFGEMFKDFKISPGIKIDTTEITASLAKVLSGAEMFKAQSGGWLNNLAIAATGGIASRFQPSLEKTRAQADAVNTIMANFREAMNTVIQDILSKESALSDMQEKGDITFSTDGSILSGTSEAKVIAAQLEESKSALASLLADAGMVDEVVGRTGGRLSEIVKLLGFTSPMLRKNNIYLANINAGLDKTGKALKFQRRDQEILNYSFQLMSRHIGQMLKRWMLMLNPISLIKRAFQDFASYDVKWQRTMNVIKYNIRRIIRPFMEWLAQQIVNVIGLVNALLKGIGSVFGQNWDLFDQSAANAEKMREELEAAANVTAGFDELHDIGGDSSNNAAMDLMGDIYTPQWDDVYKSIEDFGKTVGETFKKIYDTVKDWNFWDWLIAGAAVIVGFKILKWLIDTFSGKNPLQSVADGFKSFAKLAGVALILAAVAAVIWAAKDFIEVIKDMDFWQVVGALGALVSVISAVAGVVALLIILVTAVVSSGIGAVAVALVAVIIAAIALLIYAFADLTKEITKLVNSILNHSEELIAIINTAGEVIIKIIYAIGENISYIIDTIAANVKGTFIVIGAVIISIINAIANGITTVMQPVIDFIDGVLDKIFELAETISHEIGETIRTTIETTGEVIIKIIDSITNAIPNLLDSILRFCREIGPAIETSVDAVMRSVTKLINFIVSGVEYMINTLLIGSINGFLAKIPGVGGMIQIGSVEIPRFVPKYEVGTNYVPNDGLAYLHQGEAVVPKKYNTPYQPDNSGLANAIDRLNQQVAQISSKVDQGIAVKGQFIQRGNDLVAVVERANNKLSNNVLNNKVYAR